MVHKQPLTERQKEVLDYIRGYIDDRGIAPHLHEIAANFGIKIGSVQWIVNQLVLKGHIKKNRNKFRGMAVV